MSDESKQRVGGMGRGMKILLAVSLGLNMLVIGAVGGMMYRGGPMAGPPGARDTAYGPYTRALSHEDRKAIGQSMRHELGDFHQNLPKAQAAFAALRTALTAEVYDSDLVRRLVKEQQASGMQRQQIGQRLLLERLDAMSAKERREFAERLGRRALP
ncbi:MAG: periplasmic heavy metal sensor [Marinosulfonomonas sp.]|nr:periplasmic heavy metal sensor [Marinosulfonomonas sp.]